MTSRRRILLIASVATFATLLVFCFPRVGARPEKETQLKHAQTQSDDATSTSNNNFRPEEAVVVSNLPLSTRDSFPQSNRPGADVYLPDDNGALNFKRSGPSQLADDADEYRPRMPFIFLDHGNLLPATEEIAAAIQKLQQDFVDSTGAATANPADPDYAARWEQFQPTADEQFYAIFGSEAYNAMWNTRVHELGHF